MNILFALYHNLSSNSASHVDGVARELVKMGHECVVAVTNMDAGANRFGTTNYRVVLLDEAQRLLKAGTLFANSQPLDILHCWTPREILRKFRDRLAAAHSFHTIVHLEDNEWQLAKSFFGERAFLLASQDRLPIPYPDSLTHPLLGRDFMKNAVGCTLLIDALAEIVPPGIPTTVFWPAVDTTIFYPRTPNPDLRRELGVPDDATVLVYSGNMHAANFREVRSLYLAVHLLNRAGRNTRLIRLGNDNYTYPYGYQDWASKYAIQLGFVEDRQRIANILSLADVLVQPGKPDPFNDLRFPSKLPEFFAMGKPVILPRTNIGLVTRHLQDAYVLENANGPAIADAVTDILTHPDLHAKLGKGALSFYNSHCDWHKSARTLHDFYLTVATPHANVASSHPPLTAKALSS